MSVSKRRLEGAIEYPESDGKPMAETEFHLQVIVDLRVTLREFFRAQPRVYVGSNMFFYYVEGDPTQNIAPDLFVVRGVEKHQRRTYKLWEEGHAPNVIFEITSDETRQKDLGWKKQLYAWLGVQEYFIFDPEYKLKPPLRAFRLRGKEYVEEAVAGGRVWSEELGLELVNTGTTLRLRNPQTGEFLRTLEEEAEARRQTEAAHQAEAAARRQAEAARQAEAEARRQAEAAQRAEAAARRQAEAELERLRAELAKLKRQPTRKKSK